jgi:hypothetical protein
MISIKTTTALIVAVSSVLSVAPIAASAQLEQNAAIDDRDDNTQANFADVDQDQGEGDFGIQFAEVVQSNSLSDDDENAIFQSIFN